jgi:2-polyprenyl-3-methyl-5-hydroxy-6-metoxy-1,4-benzoquinol methylase
MREAWDSEAACFDDQPDHGLSDARVRTAWRALLQDALPAPPARVLDVGCGTGSVAVLLAELGFTVQGIDLSPRMLEQAAAKARRVGVPGAPPTACFRSSRVRPAPPSCATFRTRPCGEVRSRTSAI